MKRSIKTIVAIGLALLVAIGSFSLGRLSGLTENIRRNSSNGVGNIHGFDFNRVNKNVESLINRINKEYLYDFDTEMAEEGIYKGVLESLGDPYSVYYNEKEFKVLNEQTAGEFGGIGIQVSATQGELIEVIAPIKGTPGEKAGIQPGDKVTHINGEPFSSRDLEKAVSIMRGEPGTDVEITIMRGEGADSETFDLTITRALINVESVFPHMLEDNIGYIQMTGFQEHTAEEFVKAYNELKEKGAQKIILDLRNNPGGLLNVTIDIADFLMDEGTVINVRYKDGSTDFYKTEDGKEDLPMVTLINQGSASASEVLSGALQDNGRSQIVGETSYGKGIIQNLYPVNNSGKREGMKLTIAEFYTPNNKQIHGVGITPDIIVEIPEDVKFIGVEHLEEDTQLQKAIELLK